MFGGFDTWGMSHYLDVEKTEREMEGGNSLKDVLGWQPVVEDKFAKGVSLWITGMGNIDITGLREGEMIEGICEIKGVHDLETDRVGVRNMTLSGEPYDEDIVLYLDAEENQKWLVLEYRGEKLYFENRWQEGLSVEWFAMTDTNIES